MKVLLKNVVIKKILIVLIAIIMVSNFIMPNYVHADDDGKKALADALAYVLAWGSDSVLGAIQEIMMGTDNITERGEYKIKYGPGIIFSGSVPALDINFVTADKESDSVHYDVVDIDSKKEMAEFVEQNIITRDSFVLKKTGKIAEATNEELKQFGLQFNRYGSEGDKIIPIKQVKFKFESGVPRTSKDGKIIKQLFSDGLGTGSYIYVYDNGVFKYEKSSGEYAIYQCDLTATDQGVNVELKSTAYALKSHISTWYRALRTIALVGLLSVLIYLGIRIILSSSSAQDKAKYKNMLKDWIVAICILFTLHYIMAFLLNLTDNLNAILNNTAISQTLEGNHTDELMNAVREKVGDYDNDTDVNRFGYALMYVALIFITVKFTIQYLKRVVYIAFLTMVAPMIALTYPIDKIKDSKAQAFSFWLKEYIFNCLIQPVHLLIYTALVKSAISMAEGTGNLLYSLAALAFMIPIEKFVKDMFGMKSSSPIGTMGAAAGGALMMSLINKIKSKPNKGDAGAGAASSPKGVRTDTRNIENGNSNSSNQSGVGNGINTNNQVNNSPLDNNVNVNQNANTNNSNQQSNNQYNNSRNSNNTANNRNSNSNTNNNGTQSTSKQPTYSVGRGLATLAGFNGLASAGATLRKAGKGVLKGVGGAALASVAGSVMLANEIADGHILEDPEKAIGKIGGAAAAGYVGGKTLTENGVNSLGKIGQGYDKYSRGAMGEEMYNNYKFDKAVFASSEYKAMAQDPIVKQFAKDKKMSVRALTQEYLENGVSNVSDIRTCMQANMTGDEVRTYRDAGVTDTKEIIKLKKENISGGMYKEFANMGIKEVSKISKAQNALNKQGRTNAEIAALTKIAQMAPKGNKDKFIEFAKNIEMHGRNVSEEEAEEVYKHILDLL